MRDRRRFLKVKIKSLAAEARIIKQEERRARRPLQDELTYHRRMVVRPAARSTLLAYAFIRGRTLEQVEPTRDKHHPPNIAEVARMVEKYGLQNCSGSVKKDEAERLKEWFKPAAVPA